MTGTHLNTQKKERTPIYDNISCGVPNLLSRIGTKINGVPHINSNCETHLAFRTTVENRLHVIIGFSGNYGSKIIRTVHLAHCLSPILLKACAGHCMGEWTSDLGMADLI